MSVACSVRELAAIFPGGNEQGGGRTGEKQRIATSSQRRATPVDGRRQCGGRGAQNGAERRRPACVRLCRVRAGANTRSGRARGPEGAGRAEDRTIQQQAVVGLSNYEEESALPTIETLLASEDQFVRNIAFSVLGRYKGQKVTELIVDKAAADEALGPQAMSVLYQQGTADAAPRWENTSRARTRTCSAKPKCGSNACGFPKRAISCRNSASSKKERRRPSPRPNRRRPTVSRRSVSCFELSRTDLEVRPTYLPNTWTVGRTSESAPGALLPNHRHAVYWPCAVARSLTPVRCCLELRWAQVDRSSLHHRNLYLQEADAWPLSRSVGFARYATGCHT